MATPRFSSGSQAAARASGVNPSAPSTSADHRSVYPSSRRRANHSRWACSGIPSNGIVMPGRAGGTPGSGSCVEALVCVAGAHRRHRRRPSTASHRHRPTAPVEPSTDRPDRAGTRRRRRTGPARSSPRRRSCGTGTPQRSIPSSMCRITVSITSTRPFRLLSDEITSQGASGPLVRRSMSDDRLVVLRPASPGCASPRRSASTP